MAKSKNVVLIAAASSAATLSCFLLFNYRKEIYEKFVQWFQNVGKSKSGMGIEQTELYISWKGSNEFKEKFLSEIVIAEQCLSGHDKKGAITHLCKAMSFCSKNEQLLEIFKRNIPRDVYDLLVSKLPRQERDQLNLEGTR